MEDCPKIKKHYKSTINKKDCNYDLFKTKKAAENYFIQRDKDYKFCKSCIK